MTCKALLCTLVALPCLAARADDGVTIYGIVDAGTEVLKGSARLVRVQSGGLAGSRLGFRGSEDLGGGLKASFALESGLNINDGTVGQGGALFGRQAWVGLEGSFGSVSLGRQYSSIYAAVTDMSIFTNAAAGPSTMVIGGFGGYEPVRGAAATATPPEAGATGNGGPVRVNNSFRYESPSFDGVRFSALYGAGEVAGLTNQSRLVDFGLRYTGAGIDVVASFISDRADDGGATTRADTSTFAGSYTLGALRLVSGYVDFKDKRPAAMSGRSAWVGADYRLGTQLFKAQYIQNRPSNDASSKTEALGVGWVCDFSKRTALYSSLTRFKNDDRAGLGGLGRFNGAVPAGLTAIGSNSITEFAVGIRTSF